MIDSMQLTAYMDTVRRKLVKVEYRRVVMETWELFINIFFFTVFVLFSSSSAWFVLEFILFFEKQQQQK